MNEEVVERPSLEIAKGPMRRDLVRSQALSDLSARLAETITDISSLLQSVVQLVASFLGDTAVIRLVAEDGEAMTLMAAYDTDESVAATVRAALQTLPGDITALVPYSTVLTEAQPIQLAGERFSDALAPMPEASRAALDAVGLYTALICPLRVGGQVIGTLGLWRHRGSEPHSERDRGFAQELADRAALAIENARLVERLQGEIEQRRQNEENLRLTAALLEQVDQKRRALLEHLVSAQEEERRRIAVDVHDDSIQAMAAIGVRLQIMRRRVETPQLAEQLATIEDAVTDTISRLRALLFRLEAAPVEQVGLGRAITRYIAEVFPGGEPQTRVTSTITKELDGAMQIVLYRVAQEALSNVLKHAQATHVTVSLTDAVGGVQLTVVDDGVGFNPSEAIRHALPGHLGMRSMHERAVVAGGSLEVESKPGAGTTIRCWLPEVRG
ncbi:MAG: GAF domain-containing sensor histidine kinase [Candidatus Dormibacteraeota bacterium]|nr:GAF domain-containing sensor histidine kinase [Candidatus Dormibacteraeota bacterium]